MGIDDPHAGLSSVQSRRCGEGQRQAGGEGTVEPLAPPEEGGDRVQQQAQRAGAEASEELRLEYDPPDEGSPLTSQ